MKLRQILELLPEEKNATWVDYTDLAEQFDIHTWAQSDEFDRRVTEHYIAPWYCTDQRVGLSVILLDNRPMAVCMQSGRKCDKTYEFVSEDAYKELRDFIYSLILPEDKKIRLANLDAEFGNGYSISYGDQLLTDKATYEGRPVTIVKKNRGYDSVSMELWDKVDVQFEDGEVRTVEVNECLLAFDIKGAK